jgi:hypothetical protein
MPAASPAVNESKANRSSCAVTELPLTNVVNVTPEGRGEGHSKAFPVRNPTPNPLRPFKSTGYRKADCGHDPRTTR